MLNNSAYPNFKSHRADTVAREFRTYVRRVLCHPIEILKRQITTRRIKNSGQAYHLVLMQLEHDSAFLMHSPFASMPEFLHCVVKAFAAGAPRHHRLVFKAHPLESGRRALAREIAALAARYKIADRVDYVPGGKLAQLLDHARSAVTVNSTAGQQALWRGLPLKAFGKAVYDKPQFVSDLPLEEFFAPPPTPTVPPISITGATCWRPPKFPADFIPRGGAGNCCGKLSICSYQTSIRSTPSNMAIPHHFQAEQIRTIARSIDAK